MAVCSGAARAKPIHTGTVAVDERTVSAAHRPDCDESCSSLMSPPSCPTVGELRAWLAGYECGVLVQVETTATPGLAALHQGAAGWCCELAALRRTGAYGEVVAPLWRRLHDVVSGLEREAMRRGYYLAVGFVAGDCELCATCDPSRLCRNPLEARPSLEAMGVDIGRMLADAGWGSPPGGNSFVVRTGLVLMV
ncbi:MAG: hypothetical protein IT201_00270 [Thermoleophilia bacterium]|nr:hypothetical protein [Thermoleophilia bacterium]